MACDKKSQEVLLTKKSVSNEVILHKLMCLNIQNPKQSLHTYFKNDPD